MTPTETPTKSLHREPAVRQLLGGISHTTLWRLVRRGVVPKPIKLSPGIAVWADDEIASAIDRLATRREAV